MANTDGGGQERVSRQEAQEEQETTEESSELRERQAKLSEDVDDILDEGYSPPDKWREPRDHETLDELLVVHFDGLNFGGDTGGSEGDDHTAKMISWGISFRVKDSSTYPALITPVSTRPTGTVPIPPIL